MTDDFELTRRKALAALGTIGVASAGAGLGTSAYFSDQETFENNQLTAGELDMKVSWAEHYSDWSEDEAAFARMEDGDLVVEDREGFMNATFQEGFPDDETRAAIESGDADPCEELADVPDDLDSPVIELSDVKPGDFGEVTFDFALCDNPGYVWLNGGLLDESENGLTEPEADDPDEGSGVELADEIRVTVWYDDGDNVLEDPETIVTDREFGDTPISSSVAVSGDDRIVAQGTLREVLTQLSVENGIPLDGLPNTEGRDCYTNSPTVHYIGFAWELPVDHANEIQSDSVTFDLGFYTEQCRHNDGVGLATDLTAYYPLDGTAEDVSGNGYDGTVVGDVSYAGGQVGQAGAFDGTDDRITVMYDDNEVFDAQTDISISAWVYPTANDSGAYNGIVGSHQNNSPYAGWALAENRNGNLGLWSDNSGWSNTTQTLPLNTWTHIVVTREVAETEATVYVNGAEATTTTWQVPSDNDRPLFIGDRADGEGPPFNGRIDDVRIYSRALSANEVQSLYDAA